MKVLFRCDAGTQIGLGHLMRCLTLAKALQQHGADCHFVCRQHAVLPTQLVTEQSHALHLLSQPSATSTDNTLAHSDWLGASIADDAAQTLQAINAQSFDGLITDHYAIDARWHRAMRPYTRYILAIDDLADRTHDCDLLLDQNLGRQVADYDELVPEQTQRLIGLDYALLRDEFAQWRRASLQRRQNTSPLRQLMISMGGVDAHNISGQILEALRSHPELTQLKLSIVLGPNAPHIEALKQQIQDFPVAVQLHIGIGNMAEALAATDLVIGAAGSSAWERCCLGVPAILLMLADNQRPLAHHLQQHGAALKLDDPNATDFAMNLQQAIDQCGKQKSAMQKAAAALLDGAGVHRVCQRILSL